MKDKRSNKDEYLIIIKTKLLFKFIGLWLFIIH